MSTPTCPQCGLGPDLIEDAQPVEVPSISVHPLYACLICGKRWIETPERSE